LNPLAILIAPFAAFGGAVFGPLRFCAKIGAMIGLIVGTMMSLLLAFQPGVTFPASTLWAICALTGVVALVAVLLIVGVWLHYGAGAIFAPVLVNAAFTTILTVWITYKLQKPYLSALVGLVIGVVVGTLLCRACDLPTKRGQTTHG
jgi:hypothetical protein